MRNNRQFEGHRADISAPLSTRNAVVQLPETPKIETLEGCGKRGGAAGPKMTPPPVHRTSTTEPWRLMTSTL